MIYNPLAGWDGPDVRALGVENGFVDEETAVADESEEVAPVAHFDGEVDMDRVIVVLRSVRGGELSWVYAESR